MAGCSCAWPCAWPITKKNWPAWKPWTWARLKQGRADAVALARYLEFYGGAADKVHGQSIPFANGYTAFSIREPHGVTAHIVPWNYPMQIIGRSVGAALAMGNA